jgi:hypothetical protein
MTDRRRARLLLLARVSVVLLALGITSASLAVYTNAYGVGDRFERLVARVDRFIAGPVPDRTTRPTVTVTAPPLASPTPVVSPSPGVSPSPSLVRGPVDVDIVEDHEAVFASQKTKTWCAPAGTQMALAVLGLADTSEAFQARLEGQVRGWESYKDSHNGGWGPASISLALEAYGAPGYEVRAYERRQDALRDAASAIDATGSPVILLTWRGAHTWVMTGYQADADPTLFPDATITGAYILDPWFPRVSSIWGPSDPPGTFQDRDEMARNYLPWKRPEGRYPDRDGLFISVVPTIPVN